MFIMFDAWKHITYTGKVGDIVRIPCKQNGTPSSRAGALYEAIGGKGGWRKDKNGMVPCQYFGLWPVDDASESSFTSGYTATYEGNNKYTVSENNKVYSDYLALKIYVGANSSIDAQNPKSNVNRWLKAISFTPHSELFWIFSVITSLFVVGLPFLFSCFFRLAMKFRAKSCLKKAKAAYKEHNNQVFVF